jgi:MFS family permease
MSQPASQANPIRRVVSLRDFRLLFAGTSLSLLGDQFALIATPWLVLQLSGDPLKLGIVLALEGLPRAAFMLVGGAITDRLSPRKMMLIADALRLVLVALMAAVVLGGAAEIWMLYAFSLAFGTVAGFAVPAENSIVPMLVAAEDLQAGNALIMGITQVAGFVGPSLAGIVIGAWAKSLDGIALAYAIDAVTFAVSALCLMLIRGARPEAERRGAGAAAGILDEIRAAFRYLWADDALRLMFLLLAAVNFLIVGPLLIGIPLLARERLPEGAVAFGVLMSAFSAGNLVGFILAGTLPRPSARMVKAIVAALLVAFGAVLGVLGFIGSTAEDFVLLAALGLGNGYIAILLFTWMQNRTPKEMLGRVMSFLMFANTGLVPLSQAISGGLGRHDLDAMFVTAGALTILVTLVALTRPELTAFAESLAAGGREA